MDSEVDTVRLSKKEYEEMFGHPPPPKEARDPNHPDYGKYNTVHTREMAEAAEKRLKARMAVREAEEEAVEATVRRPLPWPWILLAVLVLAGLLGGLAWYVGRL